MSVAFVAEGSTDVSPVRAAAAKRAKRERARRRRRRLSPLPRRAAARRPAAAFSPRYRHDTSHACRAHVKRRARHAPRATTRRQPCAAAAAAAPHEEGVICCALIRIIEGLQRRSVRVMLSQVRSARYKINVQEGQAAHSVKLCLGSAVGSEARAELQYAQARYACVRARCAGSEAR